MTRICFLSTIHDARDKRVFYKEAVALANAGYDVIHIAPADEPSGEVEQNVRLITYRRRAGRFGRFKGLAELYRRAKLADACFYHCNELDSWLVGVALRVIRGKRIVFDVHEHYPSRFANGRLPRWIEPVAAASVRALFRLLTPLTERIVLAKRSVAADFSRARHKVVLVQNFAPLAMDQVATGDMRPAGRPRVMAIHLGLMSRARGWQQLVEALHLCPTKSIEVLLLGRFIDDSEPLCRARVAALGLQDRFRIETWIPMEEALRATREADIGLVLFQPGDQNHVFALPHKLFDYMLAGLPVIAPGFAEEVREIVAESGCGVLVDVADPAAIAHALDELASDRELRLRLGVRGRDAVHKQYNWEAEADKLLAMYADLVAQRRS